MDQATIAALAAGFENITAIWRMSVEAQTPEIRRDYAKLAHDDIMRWREFWDRLFGFVTPKEKP